MRIWKFPLNIQDVQSVSMPSGAAILSVANQNGTLCLWALVDSRNGVSLRTIEVIGTGHHIRSSEPYERKFIGTAVINPFVWHVFERIEKVQ